MSSVSNSLGRVSRVVVRILAKLIVLKFDGGSNCTGLCALQPSLGAACFVFVEKVDGTATVQTPTPGNGPENRDQERACAPLSCRGASAWRRPRARALQGNHKRPESFVLKHQQLWGDGPPNQARPGHAGALRPEAVQQGCCSTAPTAASCQKGPAARAAQCDAPHPIQRTLATLGRRSGSDACAAG